MAPAPQPSATDLVRAAADLYAEVESGIRTTITRYLAVGLDEPGWATNRLSAAGSLRRAVSAITAGLETKPLLAITRAITAGWDDGAAGALARVSAAWFRRSGLAAGAMASKEQIPRDRAIAALVGEVAGRVRPVESAILRQTLGAYRSVIAAATAQSIGSGVTNREAASRAWTALATRGFDGFTDQRGRQWQLSSYVEMAVRTSTARASTIGAEARCESAGLNLLLATGHSQSCSRCAPFQGRILRRGRGPVGNVTVTNELTGQPMQVYVVATLEDAQRDGFQHPNCRHGVTGYVPGATRMEPPPPEDPEMYAARMEQRALEREVRRYKTQLETALAPVDEKAATRRLAAAEEALTSHISAYDLKRQQYRETPGLGMTGGTRTVGALYTPGQSTLL